MADPPARIAVILLNLGGPGHPQATRPFLANLFNDAAILRVPFFLRRLLAWLIARTRVKAAGENYALLGGRSPLLELTRTQAVSLEASLPSVAIRCFMAMRYWHPLSDATVRAVQAWRPNEIVLLSLYPQYSTTTLGSSLAVWRNMAARAGLIAPTRIVCCYPVEPTYIASLVDLVRAAYIAARRDLPPTVPLRVLFSAHGLPESIIRSGDPYQRQIDLTVAAVLSSWAPSELDWVTCYQSRATPQKWIEPATAAEIERAAHDKVAVLVVPIAFVSEHSETLVELDVEYRALAARLGVPGYFRSMTPGSVPSFVAGLAEIICNIRNENRQ